MTKWAWPCTKKLPKVWRFSFNIYKMAHVNDFKLSTELRLAKAHHNIAKCGRDLRLKKLPKKLGFPFNISAMAEANDFKIRIQLGFAKAHHYIIHQKKWTWPWARKTPKYLGSHLITTSR